MDQSLEEVFSISMVCMDLDQAYSVITMSSSSSSTTRLRPMRDKAAIRCKLRVFSRSDHASVPAKMMMTTTPKPLPLEPVMTSQSSEAEYVTNGFWFEQSAAFYHAVVVNKWRKFSLAELLTLDLSPDSNRYLSDVLTHKLTWSLRFLCRSYW